MESNKIKLCVPADRNMLLIIRMTSSGVMSRAGMTLDEMDDMKMAIDEACNMMMLQKQSCRTLLISYEYSDDAVCVNIEGEGIDDQCAEKEDDTMQEVIRCILEAMVDEVSIMPHAGGGTGMISLKKHVSNERRRSAV